MKVTAPSGDLLIKLAIVAAGVGVAVYVIKKAGSAVVDTAAAAANAVNPLNHDNIFAAGVNAAGGAVMSAGGPTTAGMNADGSWTLGGYVYDMTHRDAVTGKYAWWQF